MRIVEEMLRRIKPATLIDVGCNSGWYSRLAANAGAHVLALDLDEVCLTKLCDQESAPGTLQPCLFDLADPTTAHGTGGRHPAAGDRWRAEAVLSIAAVHYLFFKRNMSFSLIAEGLSRFTSPTGTLIVEFIPHHDEQIATWSSSSTHPYTTEAFHAELQRWFAGVEIVLSSPAPRLLFIGTGRR